MQNFESAYRLVASETISKSAVPALGTRRVGTETLALVPTRLLEGAGAGIESKAPTLDDIMSFDPDVYDPAKGGAL